MNRKVFPFLRHIKFTFLIWLIRKFNVHWRRSNIAHCENSTFAYIVSVLTHYFLAVHLILSQGYPFKQIRVNINKNILFIILYAKNILLISINIFNVKHFQFISNIANKTKDYSKFTLCPLNSVHDCILMHKKCLQKMFCYQIEKNKVLT